MPHLKGMHLHHTVHTTRKPPNVKAINPFANIVTTTTRSAPKLYPLPSKTPYSFPKQSYHHSTPKPATGNTASPSPTHKPPKHNSVQVSSLHKKPKPAAASPSPAKLYPLPSKTPYSVPKPVYHNSTPKPAAGYSASPSPTYKPPKHNSVQVSSISPHKEPSSSYMQIKLADKVLSSIV